MSVSILGLDKQDYIADVAKSLVGVPGDFAECGIYRGGVLARLAKIAPQRTVYGFDTFTGLPSQKWTADEIHEPGDFADTALEFVRSVVASNPNVVLIPGVFPDSACDLDAATFALVHIDFDFYESTRDAIEWFLPRMSDGGVIVFDDYEWERCPGVKRAIDERGLIVEKTVPYQAIWRNTPQ